MAERIGHTPRVEALKNYFIDVVKDAGRSKHFYLTHVPEVERWANIICDRYPQIDRQIVLFGVWGHDIGNMLGDPDIDHAINSEVEVRSFLQEIDTPQDTVEAVAHCVRAHRNKDVPPASEEAKALAVADSASHMTSDVYIDMCRRGEKENAMAKLERDWRDVAIFPEFQEMMADLYKGWGLIINSFPY